MDVKGLVTHSFRLADFENALRVVDDPVENALKVIVTL